MLGIVVLSHRLEGAGAAPPCGGEERQRCLRMRRPPPLVRGSASAAMFPLSEEAVVRPRRL